MNFFNSFNRKNGVLIREEKKCTYCGICQTGCPHKAIRVDASEHVWKLRLICMKCGRCVRECPESALMLKKDEKRLLEDG